MAFSIITEEHANLFSNHLQTFGITWCSGVVHVIVMPNTSGSSRNLPRNPRSAESRKRVREANGSSLDMDPVMRDAGDTDSIDVDMDAYEEEVPVNPSGPLRNLQLRSLAHVPYYPHLGGEDFDDDFVAELEAATPAQTAAASHPAIVL